MLWFELTHNLLTKFLFEAFQLGHEGPLLVLTLTFRLSNLPCLRCTARLPLLLSGSIWILQFSRLNGRYLLILPHTFHILLVHIDECTFWLLLLLVLFLIVIFSSTIKFTLLLLILIDLSGLSCHGGVCCDSRHHVLASRLGATHW